MARSLPSVECSPFAAGRKPSAGVAAVLDGKQVVEGEFHRREWGPQLVGESGKKAHPQPIEPRFSLIVLPPGYGEIDGGDELSRVADRLFEHVAHRELAGALLDIGRGTRRHENDGDGDPAPADLAGEIDPVHPGHLYVGNDRVGIRRVHQRKRVERRLESADAEAALLENPREDFAHQMVVIDHKNGPHSPSTLASRDGRREPLVIPGCRFEREGALLLCPRGQSPCHGSAAVCSERTLIPGGKRRLISDRGNRSEQPKGTPRRRSKARKSNAGWHLA